jgi:hypothetical protein
VQNLMSLSANSTMKCRPADPRVERQLILVDCLVLGAPEQQSCETRIGAIAAVGINYAIRDLVQLDEEKLPIQVMPLATRAALF